MPKRKNGVTQMSSQIREDTIKITLIPTRENSLRMTWLRHVTNRETPSVMYRSWAMEELGQREVDTGFPGLSDSYWITGWFNQGALFQPGWSWSDLLPSLIYRGGWSKGGKTLRQFWLGGPQSSHRHTHPHPDPPLRAWTKGLSEICRALGSPPKSYTGEVRSQGEQAGQD